MIIGIDIGGTTTDIVGLKNGNLLSPLTVKADDPVTSAAGALGKFVESNNLQLSEIRLIAATGVGSNYIHEKLLGINVLKVDEFSAIGTAGSYLSGIKSAIVVSLGTGTAVVSVNNQEIKHWGGSGVGGGTLMGLSQKLLNITSIQTLVDKAVTGRLEMVDLTVGDIAGGALDNLPESVTASNFGKISDEATNSDIALAIFNLVSQTVALMGISAARAEQLDNIIFTGKLTILEPIKKILDSVARLYRMNIKIPEHAEFATAIGAAIEADSRDK